MFHTSKFGNMRHFFLVFLLKFLPMVLPNSYRHFPKILSRIPSWKCSRIPEFWPFSPGGGNQRSHTEFLFRASPRSPEFCPRNFRFLFFRVYPGISKGVSSRMFRRCYHGTSPEIPRELFFLAPTGVPPGLSQGVLPEISPRDSLGISPRDFLDIFPRIRDFNPRIERVNPGISTRIFLRSFSRDFYSSFFRNISKRFSLDFYWSFTWYLFLLIR